MNRYFNRPIAPNDAPVTGEINLDDTTTLQPLQKFTTDYTKMITSSPKRSLSPSEYFTVASPHVSTLLVSPQNFSNIQTIANSYPSGLTNFLGFECRLNGDESQHQSKHLNGNKFKSFPKCGQIQIQFCTTR
jgi:hypothetical protein